MNKEYKQTKCKKLRTMIFEGIEVHHFPNKHCTTKIAIHPVDTGLPNGIDVWLLYGDIFTKNDSLVGFEVDNYPHYFSLTEFTEIFDVEDLNNLNIGKRHVHISPYKKNEIDKFMKYNGKNIQRHQDIPKIYTRSELLGDIIDIEGLSE